MPRPAKGELPGRLFLGARDAGVYYLFVLFAFGICFWNRFGLDIVDKDSFWTPRGGMAIRWFLAAILEARLFIRACQKLEDLGIVYLPPSAQVLLLFLPAFILWDRAGDICQNTWAPMWLKYTWGILVTPGYADGHICSTFDSTVSYNAAIYSVFFHYSHRAKAMMQATIRGRCDGPCWALAAVGLYFACTFTAAHYHFAMYYDMRSATEGKHLGWLPLDFVFLFATFGLFTFAAAYFPFSSSWTGRASAGIYFFHVFFVSNWGARLKESILQHAPMPGIVLLLVMTLPIILWMAIIGPIGNYVLLLPVRAYQRFEKKNLKAA